MSRLKVSGICKSYRVELPREDAFSALLRFFSGRSPTRAFDALSGVSFTLKPGASLALCGPNGSGKTTLLKILAGITAPSAGEVSFAGRKTCLLGFASILQDRLSVKENARLCAVFFELPGDPAENAEAIMAAAGLEHLRNARAGELSAGMKLRLPFMAALSSGADLFLIDETLAVGDAEFRGRCLKELKAINARGAILVFATHDAQLARALATQTLTLEGGRAALRASADEPPAAGAARVPGDVFKEGLARFALLHAMLKEDGYKLCEAPPSSDEEILSVHSPSWLARLKANDLSRQEEAALAMPHSKLTLPLSWRMAGGTLTAARAAAASGSLGVFPHGGGHHAFSDRGEGFCPVNDIAIAARCLLKEGAVKNPAVIDLDAHQGNGTACIAFSGGIKTFSAHKADGYPSRRVRSTMDVDIPSGSGDEAYLEAVKKGVKDFLEMARPDFVFALCSADAYEKDALGGLKVSSEGLRERDEFLFRTLAGLRLPVCLVLGGAYGPPGESARINYNTIKAAAAAYPSYDRVIQC
jgi:acetoin utilization deacetylase AcuC-like enzyme/ABC-type polysaccharide/polyol phosphate transport system ATPase subunit